MPYVANDGIRIHYEVEGGRPVSCASALGQKASSWHLAGYVDALRPHL